MKALTILLWFILTGRTVSDWCPILPHDHKNGFRVGPWAKKKGMYQRVRICRKKGCKYNSFKQIQYKKQ